MSRSVEEVWEGCKESRRFSEVNGVHTLGKYVIFGSRSSFKLKSLHVVRANSIPLRDPSATINLALLELTQEFLDYGT